MILILFIVLYKKGLDMFLYHGVPDNFVGTLLHPLNYLRRVSPEVYELARQKYKGKEHITDQRVPVLHCWWNDVVFLSPVHPSQMHVSESKGEINLHKPRRYFQISSEDLDNKKMLALVMRQGVRLFTRNASDLFEYVPFSEISTDDKRAIVKPPHGSFEQDGISSDFLFSNIPHILHYGSINVEGVPTISY